MSRNISSLTKWLPSEILEYENFFGCCRELEITSLNLIKRFNILLNNLKQKQYSKFNHALKDKNELQVTVSTYLLLDLRIIAYYEFTKSLMLVFLTVEV